MSKGKLFLFFVFIAALIAAISMPTTSSNSNGNQTQSYGLIVGRNVNMVSGTEAPNGDPYLQRQNEPSGAVSTRNPMHILAGANDYRTIDIPFQDKLPGKEEYLAQIRDAWVGVFKSFNGGESWISTLLPGYPQDTSPEGTSSPLHGYDFACDPTVRAGANGLFYYSGIAAERGDQARGVVFVARYIDSNNSEFLDTIEYVDTRIPDYGTKGLFLDMPHTAVDVPRGGGTVTIKEQEIPRSNVYITYTRFLGKSGRNVQDQVMFARSTDCGETWSNPIILSQSRLILQRPTIAIDPSDPTGKTIYVAFRQFMHPAHTTAITIVKSTDWGQTFTLPIHVTSFIPFDQVSSTRSFRTTSYPSLAVDADGIVYLAWTQRNEPEGPARIVIATSADGINWPSNQMKYVENYHATEEVKGHQFMPSLTYAGDKLMLGWYDQRHDIAQNPVILSDGAFTPYIEDWDCRHTIDVRVAYGEPGLDPIFSPSRQVSRYLYTLYIDEYGEPIEENGYWKIDQAEFNAINYPLFQQGTTPFHGDWMEAVPSPWIFLPPNGQWSFNTELSQPTTSLMIWTDNRDVNPPGGSWWGDWTDYFEWPLYSAPDSEQEPGWEPPACEYELNTGMRNQNIYTANVSDGLIVGSPQNTKQLDPLIQRTFVVYAKNTTEQERYFKFIINELGNATASFEQDLYSNVHELKVAITPLSSASVTVYVDPYTGGNSTTIMVEVVEIGEDGDVMPGGLYGYVLLNPDATNPDVIDHSDPNNPVNLGDEHHNPRVQGPRVWGYDLGNASEMNPRVQGPRVQGYGHINTGYINPRVQGEDPLNPRVQGPRVWGPRVQGPRVQGINVLNQDVINPRVQGPRVQGTALTDITYPIVNDGNTTSAYSINLRSLLPEDFDEDKLIAQLLIYKVYTSPVSDGCELKQVHHDELVTNIYNPRVQGPRVQGGAQTSSATSQINGDWKIPEPTIYLEPGQMGYVTVRVWDDDTTDSIVFSPDNVTIDMPAQAPDTGETEPEIGFPPGHGPGQWPGPTPKIWRSPESLSFTAQEGGQNPNIPIIRIKNIAEGTTLNYNITTDVPWLTVSPDSGTSSCIVSPCDTANEHAVFFDFLELSAGTYTGNIAIFDPTYEASNNPQFVRVKLYVVSEDTEASQVKLSGPTWVVAGEISKVYTLVSLDSDGNPANVTGNTIFNLTSTSSGAKFYSDFGGSNEITHVTIADESSSAIFYYKDTEAGDHTITATDSNLPGLGSASHPISVITPPHTVSMPNIPSGPTSGTADISYTYSTGGSVCSWGDDVEYRFDWDDGNQSSWSSSTSASHSWDTASTYNVTAQARCAADPYIVSGWSDALTVTINEPGFEIAYVYSTDTTSADSFKTFLETIQISTTIIELSSVTGGMFTNFDVILIGADTGGAGYDWGDNSKVPAIESSDKPIIGLGLGGAKFFEQLGTYIGYGHGMYVEGYPAEINVIDPSHIIFNSPNNLTGSPISVLYSPSRRFTQHVPTPQDDVVLLGQEPSYLNHYPLVIEKDRYFFWGYEDPPESMTNDGKNLFENVVRWSATLTAVGCVWSQSFSSTNQDQGLSVAVDGARNVIVTGNFTDTVDFGGGTLTAVGTEIFLAKFDAAGNHLWSQNFGRGSGLSVAVDGSENIFVTGSFTGTVDFGGNPLTSAGGSDIFLAKFDAAGNHLWSQRFGAPGGNGDFGFGVAVDLYGNVVLTGLFENTVDFGGNPLTSAGGSDIFLAKYDADGEHLWSQRFGGTESSYFPTDKPFDVAFDGDGNVLMTGMFVGPVDFGGGPITGFGRDIFLAKYDSNGGHLWSKGFGDTTGGGRGESVAIDGSGNVFVTGAFEAQVDFGGGTLTAVGSDIFLAKYDAAGNHLWSQNFISTDGDQGFEVEIDAAGNVLVTGMFSGTVDFGGGPLVSAGQSCIFLAKYDAAGNHLWSQHFGELAGVGRSVATDGTGDVLVTGDFGGTVDFCGVPLVAADGFSDIFLVKFERISSGAAADLRWNVKPLKPIAQGVTWEPFSIKITDQLGYRIAGATDAVTIFPATLGGTLTQNAVDGVATFDDIYCDTPGSVSVYGEAAELNPSPPEDVEVLEVLTSVPNPSFEDDVDQNGVPDGWEPVNNNVTFLYPDDFGCCDSNRSVGMSCVGTCNEIAGWTTTNFIYVQPNREYAESVWYYVKNENTPYPEDYSGLIEMYVTYYDKHGNYIGAGGGGHGSVPPSIDWVQISGSSGPSPQDYRMVKITLQWNTEEASNHNFTSPVEVYFDYIQWEAEDPQIFAGFTQDTTYSSIGLYVQNEDSRVYGWAFETSGCIEITELGYFDSSQDGLLYSHDIGVWDQNGVLLGSATVPSGTGGSLDGAFRYVSVSPILLEANKTYIIGATIQAEGDDHVLRQFDAINLQFDSKISFVEGRVRVNATGLNFPEQVTAGELNTHLDANFKGILH